MKPVPETMQQTQPPQQFQPFVPPTESRPELTFRALLLGSIFGILFGAVTVYVGLRAGLTVAASIPIAVLSISVLRGLGRAQEARFRLHAWIEHQKGSPLISALLDEPDPAGP